MNRAETYGQAHDDNGIGWYGKIPGCGDFVQRRLPTPLINQWAHWFQSGLATLPLSAPHHQRYSLSDAPMWNFILPATLGAPFIQLGCLLASQDRVGRHYPLLALWRVAPEAWHNGLLAPATERYYRLGQALNRGVHQRHSPERIDRALLALPPLPTPSAETSSASEAGSERPIAALDFDPQRYSSFWWSGARSGRPFESWTHSGNLTVQLFHHLFTPVGGLRSTPRGLYGHMFDEGIMP